MHVLSIIDNPTSRVQREGAYDPKGSWSATEKLQRSTRIHVQSFWWSISEAKAENHHLRSAGEIAKHMFCQMNFGGKNLIIVKRLFYYLMWFRPSQDLHREYALCHDTHKGGQPAMMSWAGRRSFGEIYMQTISRMLRRRTSRQLVDEIGLTPCGSNIGSMTYRSKK